MNQHFVRPAIALALVIHLTGAWQRTQAQTDPTNAPPSVERGLLAYKAKCSSCHGADMSGGPGSPALIGPEFLFKWQDKSADELLDFIIKSMPPGQEDRLPRIDYRDIVAALQSANGLTPQPEKLPAR